MEKVQNTDGEKKVSILLPTYNERENIVPLITRIQSAVKGEPEIIVIDDDSPDGTAGAVTSSFSHDPSIRLIVRQNEHGLASALQKGIDSASGDIVVWMDCDLSMPPEKIPDLLLQLTSQGYDAAVGSRYVPGGKDSRPDSRAPMLIFQTILSLIITRWNSFFLCSGFKDWTSGFIAVKRSVLCEFPLQGDYGEYFIALMYSIIKKGHRVVEVPYQLIPRKHGMSKTAVTWFDFFRRGIKYANMSFCLKWRSHSRPLCNN